MCASKNSPRKLIKIASPKMEENIYLVRDIYLENIENCYNSIIENSL